MIIITLLMHVPFDVECQIWHDNVWGMGGAYFRESTFSHVPRDGARHTPYFEYSTNAYMV